MLSMMMALVLLSMLPAFMGGGGTPLPPAGLQVLGDPVVTLA